jgi:hypothetical protein
MTKQQYERQREVKKKKDQERKAETETRTLVHILYVTAATVQPVDYATALHDKHSSDGVQGSVRVRQT